MVQTPRSFIEINPSDVDSSRAIHRKIELVGLGVSRKHPEIAQTVASQLSVNQRPV